MCILYWPSGQTDCVGKHKHKKENIGQTHKMSALPLLHAVGKLPFCCTQGQLWVALACWSILHSSQVRAGKSLVGETAMSCCRPPCKFQAVMPASRNNSLSIPVPKFFSPNFNEKKGSCPKKKSMKIATRSFHLNLGTS